MWISRLRWGALISLLLAAGLLQGGNAQEGERFFPETAHSVSGEFLLRYQASRDPLLLYGYPISEAFQDPTGRLVQYFQRARFDLYPELPPEQRVAVFDLGEHLYTPGLASSIPLITAACRLYPGTDDPVCYAFRDFYEHHGGVEQFGLPISGFEQQGGRLVQYFEKACFEWRPEEPAGQRVRLSNLGEQYLNMFKTESSSAWNATVGTQPLMIQVSAYPQQPVMGLNGQQTILVKVADQDQQPVAGAQVTLQQPSPGGQVEGNLLQAVTDYNGIAMLTFPFDFTVPGKVVAHITVRVNNLESKTTTSFWTWW
jgi:hypothetical protein